jgi:hypothetical protein
MYMASPRVFPYVLTAAALSLAACSPVQSGASLPGSAEATGVAGPGARPIAGAKTPAASTGALTPEAYRAQIGEVRGPVRAALTKLAGANGLTALKGRAGDAEQALTKAATSLESVTAPPQVQAQHVAYVSALRGLSAGLGAARGAVDSRTVCTASGLLATLGASGEWKKLADAGDALGDYPADVVNVKAPKETSRRLPNGRYIRTEQRSGKGNFAIDNGGERDAVITLVRGKSKVISVYVQKKGKFTVPGVRDGKYSVFFTTGVDWDSKAKAFTRSCSFQRFDESFAFKTTFTSTEVRWSNWRISLHETVGGNAKTSEIDPGEFPA